MNEFELARHRHQMGRSLELLSRAGPRPHCEHGPGFWMACSGVASPDANVALIETDDAATRRHVLEAIRESELPVTVVLAGPGLAVDLGEDWRHVGDMPLMEISLAAREFARDGRVRAASETDVDAISELLASAYSISRDESNAVAAFAATGSTEGTMWLLVDQYPVATAFTAILNDAVCIWSLATPQRYERRGYARALLDDVLSRARDASARIGLLGATPAGAPLYLRNGWRTIETWRLFTQHREH